jgi:hypothetical protein
MSRIESRTIKARHEICIDSYKGKLSRKDLTDAKPFDHRKATETRFVDWITGDRETNWIYRSKLGDIVAVTYDIHGKPWG